MALHVVYRLALVADSKPRPEYFSKGLALGSLLRAAEGVAADITFFVDGPATSEWERVLEEYGKVRFLPRVGNSGSFRHTIEWAAKQGWPAEDVVYFCEDDYLHMPGSLQALADIAGMLPAHDSFTLYEHPNAYTTRSVQTGRSDRKRRRRGERMFFSHGQHWRTMMATCMTFGMRVGALRDAAGLVSWASTGAAPDDYGFWRAMQNSAVRAVEKTIPSRLPSTVRHSVLSKSVEAIAPAGSRIRFGRIFDLVVPVPALATHLHEPFLALGQDWGVIADDTEAWMVERPRLHRLTVPT